MISLLSVIVLGFFLGVRHATDPDHVIAVSTIVSRHRSIRHAALIGALWGAGHTLTILVVGCGIILFGWVIPTRIGLSMEFSVSLMLILLGIFNLTGIWEWITACVSPTSHPQSATIYSHVHAQGRFIYAHVHAQNPEARFPDPARTPLSWLESQFGRIGLFQAARPLIVGIVHGLAGSAAVALLVLTTIREPRWAVVYLLIFGLGTVAGMMLITGAISMPFTWADQRFARLNRGLRVASGMISVGFGLFLVYQIAFVNGLFSSHPQWTPR